MASFDEILKMYQCGNFDMCLKTLNETFSGSMEGMKKMEKLSIQLENIDDITLKALVQNDALVCEAIAQNSRLVVDNTKWIHILESFIQLYSQNRSLTVIPMELELNFVCNSLWWYCMVPRTRQDKNLYKRKVQGSVFRCIIKVLRLCGETVVGQSEDNLVSVFRLATDQLLRLSSVACIQLISILALSILAFEDFLTDDALPMIRSTADQLELIKTHVQRRPASTAEEFYFKFGFANINSSVSLKHSEECLVAFTIVGSIIIAVNGEYNAAFGYLEKIEEDDSFQFLLNYLKAYCCLRCERHNEAHLYLAYAAGRPMVPRRAALHRLLLARLLGEAGDWRGAMTQCQAALSEAPRQANRLAAAVAIEMNETTAHLTYLKQYVQCMKRQQEDEGRLHEDFEESCLSLLDRHEETPLAEASYSLARQLYLAGYHIKALDAYKEMMEVIGSIASLPCSLPPTIQLLHETVLSHLKADSLQEGEQLCRRLISDYTPTTETSGRWERALYSLQDDVISMILLADILTSDKRMALEQLNRCYNAVVESREKKTDERMELCDWLLSRILLRKAQLSGPAESQHYYRRALMHKPGDKVVVYHYKQWALWNPEHQSFDPGDQFIEFSDDEVANLALRYVLGCSVTKEEWDALCDPESSNHLIDALFDDND